MKTYKVRMKIPVTKLHPFEGEQPITTYEIQEITIKADDFRMGLGNGVYFEKWAFSKRGRHLKYADTIVAYITNVLTIQVIEDNM